MNKNQNLMNKTQLTAIVAEKTGISKADAAKYVNAVLGTIADTLVCRVEDFPDDAASLC